VLEFELPRLGQFMRRREFIGLVSGAAVTWPLAVRAQQGDRVRRIGILTPNAESDPESQTWIKELTQRLRELGWTSGGNIRIDYRFGNADMPLIAKAANELIELRPDVVLAVGTPAAAALRQWTLSIPIVFVQVADPVAGGFVTNLARPEGNITGFTNFEFSIGGKWLSLLKECAPSVVRIALVFDPGTPSWTAFLRTIEAAAPSFGVQLTPAGVRDATEIDQRIAAFAREPSGALVVFPSGVTIKYRELIIAAAARHRLPAIYPYGVFTADGGLMSYGVEVTDLYRRAASYVDRILRGSKVAELPVQQPTKYVLAINLKTAKALGLTVPQTLRAAADEVIE
jgi:putative ABC transport system substrate-binding protein